MRRVYIHILDHSMIAGRWYLDRDFDNILRVVVTSPWPAIVTINFNNNPQSTS